MINNFKYVITYLLILSLLKDKFYLINFTIATFTKVSHIAFRDERQQKYI